MLETIVSEEDFLNTFENGLKDSMDYQLIQRLRSQGETGKQMAGITGRPETTVQSWIKHRKPKCLHALEQAKALEIVPLTKNSPKLPAIYELCAWVFWTGFLTQGYEPRICEKKETLEMLKEYFLRTLQLKSAYTVGAIRFSGHNYGRVLYAMGVPAGHRKSAQEIHVPKAILEDQDAHFRFLEILFKTRRSTTKKHWTIYLMENAETLGKEIVQLMNTAMPELALTDKNLYFTQGKRRSPRISLPKKAVVEIKKHYPELNEPSVLSPENSYCNTHTVLTCQPANQ